MSQPEWIPLSEATRLSGLSSRTLRRMVAEGQLKGVKTRGGHLRVSRDSIDKLLRPALVGASFVSPVAQSRRERVEELRAEADELIADRQIKKLRAENSREQQTALAETEARAFGQRRAAEELRVRRAEDRKREKRLLWESRWVNAVVEQCSQQYSCLSVEQRREIADQVRQTLQGYTERDDSNVISAAIATVRQYTVETWAQERREEERGEQLRKTAIEWRKSLVERATWRVGATESEILQMKSAACDALSRIPVSVPEWEIELAVKTAIAPIANAIERRQNEQLVAREASRARETADLQRQINDAMAKSEREKQENVRRTLISRGELAIDAYICELYGAGEIDRAALRDTKWHEQLKAQMRDRIPNDATEWWNVIELAHEVVDEDLGE